MRRMKSSRRVRWEDSLAWAERKTALEARICPMQAAAGRWAINPPEAPGKPPQAPRSVGDSDWAEDKHPRDEGGRFTSGGGAARPRKYKKKVVKLPAQEYALVMHELNTHLPAGQKKKKFVHKAIGNYMYTVRVNGIDDYEIVRKVPIK